LSFEENKMDTREMIERALKSTIGKACLEAGFDSATLAGILTIAREILAEQAIVIEGKVGHHGMPEAGKWTNFYYAEGGRLVATLASGNHIGTPGKAIAIIISLEEQCKAEATPRFKN